MSMVNIDETLKNIGTYWEVYCFVAEKDRSLDEIKKFLMVECDKPESTARAQVSAFKSARDNIFEFCENKNRVRISVDKVNALEKQMDDFLGFTEYDYRSDLLHKYEKTEREWKQECQQCRKEFNARINRINKEAWNCQMNSYRKQIECLKKLLVQPVLVTNDAFIVKSEKYYKRDFSFYSNRREKEDFELDWIASQYKVTVSSDKNKWEAKIDAFKAKGLTLKERLRALPGCLVSRWKMHKYMWIANSVLYIDLVERFARQMVEQKWLIIADFNGKKEPFKIVPERYLEDLRTQVEDLEKQINSKPEPKEEKW